jgi:adenylate kinase
MVVRHHVSRLVLLGRPGSGKSTQASQLAARLGLVHLSSGEVLRQEAASLSAIGRAIALTLERGELVADDLAVAAILPDLEKTVSLSGGYVLDGLPRDLVQAQWLAGLVSSGLEPQVAVSLEVNIEECRRRLLDRARLENRSDDARDTIERRLAAYERETSPVIAYYERAGILAAIDGEGSPEGVTARILERFGGARAKARSGKRP